MASSVAFPHDFAFDPAYGYDAPDALLGIPAPPAPDGF
ncbi:acetylxylan esterase, partial [Streptomyces sp. SID7499]|nr:acetylxylan esterase [Streptomyces sp. SID7499]